MAVDPGWTPSQKVGRRGTREKGLDSAWFWRMSGLARDGTGRPNLSSETKFSGANGDREKHFLCSIDHEQYWQPHHTG